jgi:hypothetical protein
MTIDFEDLLPEGTRVKMINNRISELAAEGLANQIAKAEAEARGDVEEVAVYEENINKIVSIIQANQAELI